MKTLILLMFWIILISPLVEAVEVQEIVAKASHAAYYQGNDGKARVAMKIFDKQNRTRTREFTILRRDEPGNGDRDQKLYVYFHSPSDVNKSAFLVWKHISQDDDRWLYLPALDLVKRISASDERTSFMGSHFFYEDVSGRTPAEDRHQLLEETKHYYVVKSVPVDSEKVEFAFYKNWIHKTTFIPVKTEFFNTEGKAYRTYEAIKVDMVQGIPTVTKAKMSDSRIGGYTEMGYSKVAYDIGLPDNIFSERYLRNAPRRHLR